MRRSTERILVTHVGSLPRGEALNELLIRAELGEAVDADALAAETERRTAEVFRRQIAAGIDVPNDGEQARVGFQTYIPQRMSGFGGESKRPRPKEFQDFPVFAQMVLKRHPRRGRSFNAPQAIADVRYHDDAAIQRDIDRLRRLAKAEGKPLSDCFMTAPSPGIISTTLLNAHYASHEAYVNALAKEMRHEYLAIANAGLILQVDAPDLAMERHVVFQDRPLAEYIAVCELHVAALNAALNGIPPEQVRLHCCWGNWEGPHVHDVPLAEILPVLAQARVGGLSIEFANPRHQHEYEALRRCRLPKSMILLPGIIDTSTNFVEHPETVARRIVEAARAVGDRERVVASTDCGFGTFAGFEWVAEDVVWAKLAALRAGADIASARLWGRDKATA